MPYRTSLALFAFISIFLSLSACPGETGEADGGSSTQSECEEGHLRCADGEVLQECNVELQWVTKENCAANGQICHQMESNTASHCMDDLGDGGMHHMEDGGMHMGDGGMRHMEDGGMHMGGGGS